MEESRRKGERTSEHLSSPSIKVSRNLRSSGYSYNPKTNCMVVMMVVLVLLLLLCPSSSALGGGSSDIPKPRYTSEDPEDPCKAAGYMGDIALDEDQYNYMKHKQSLYTTPPPPSSPASSSLSSPSSSIQHQHITLPHGHQQQEHGVSHGDRDNARGSDSGVLRRRRRKQRKHKRRRQHARKFKNIEEKKRRRQERRQKRLQLREDETESDHRRNKRAATARKERLWDFGVIPYEIEANFSGAHKALFKQAMRHWENYTCVTFVERTPEDYNYILFTERPCGCCSFVGKRGNGAQAISIGKNCDKFGIIVHELGHVVGFWHEHTRPDRDDHVEIVHKNILQGQEYNFNKLSSSEVNSLGMTYDFASIMHYARNTFSRGTYVDTIVPRRPPDAAHAPRPEIGQRERLSTGDIHQAQRLYNCPACGRTLQESSGVFSSPALEHTSGGSSSSSSSVENNHVEYRPKPELCQWRIAATHGEKIVLNITLLDILDTHDCYTDYLLVRDGHWHKSKLLGKFCGNKLPGTLVSSDSRMWIEYRSSGRGLLKGFSSNYEAVCGGEIIKEQGRLSSPNYPDFYKPNKECVWKITVPEGYSVALKFQSFEIESHDNCVYDYLEVRDGHEETSRLIGKYCGYKIPSDINSTANKLYVKFVSDSSVQKGGFAATFIKEYDECATSDHGCHHNCENTMGGFRCSCNIGYELHSDGKKCEDACGGYLDTANGTIQSPSYPDLYPPNKNCVWQIVAPTQYRITLNFTHFDLEGNNQDCEYDSVEIHSGLEKQSTVHGSFCGTHLPGSITSDGNSLRLTFSTDNTVQKTGFVTHFFTDKDECAVDNGGCQHLCENTVGSYKCACNNGFTLHENKHDCKEGGCQHEIRDPAGDISSPNWPEYYPSRKDCVWRFITRGGHRLKLTFNDFELEPHQECTYDHVEIYDGDGSEDRMLGKYCGATTPDPILASGNLMYMTFYSDASVQRKGFHATYTTVCGGRMVASPNPRELFSHVKYGDHHYDNNQDCEWVITAAQEHQRVRFTFLAFEVEDETDCRYDFVELYDGRNTGEKLLGKYCRTEIPPEVISSGRHLLVRFRTDDTINWKGFSAIYLSANEGDEPVTGQTGTNNHQTLPFIPKPKTHSKKEKMYT